MAWAGIRKDILQNIVDHLDSSIDVLRVRAVCYSWRLLIPKPSNIRDLFSGSLRLPFPIGYNTTFDRKLRGYFNLVESKIYCIEPLQKISKSSKTTKSWFIKIQENQEGKMIIKNPLSKFAFSVLPKDRPKFLNVLDYRVTEVCKAYDLDFVELGGKRGPNDIRKIQATNVKKVIVSSDPFGVLVNHTGGELYSWKLDHKKWTPIQICVPETKFICQDIAFHDGMFIAVYSSGMALSMSPILDISVVAESLPESKGTQKFLVTSMGDLYLVDKFIDLSGDDKDGNEAKDEDGEKHVDENGNKHVDEYGKKHVDEDGKKHGDEDDKNDENADEDEEEDDKMDEDEDVDEDENDFYVDMMVYKLNKRKLKWELIKGLNDKVFFLGNDCCFSVSAKNFAGCKANCILFTDPVQFMAEHDPRPGQYSGLIDLGDLKGGGLSAFPEYSKIFWPPPTWLKPVPRYALQQRW